MGGRYVSVPSDEATPPAPLTVVESLRVDSASREQQLLAASRPLANERRLSRPLGRAPIALDLIVRRTTGLLWVLILVGQLLMAPGAKADLPPHWTLRPRHERPGVSWQRWADWYHSVLDFASISGLRPYSERHQRTVAANANASACQSSLKDQCLSLNTHTINDICSEVKLSRLRCLSRIQLFATNASNQHQLSLENLFLLPTVTARDFHAVEADKFFAHLSRDTVDDCLLSGQGNSACQRCFELLLNVTNRVQRAYEQFDMVLKQVDCGRGQEEIFSLRSTCEECQARYREWLLVTQLSGSPNSPWKYKPCLNYCEITELYCPHLKNTDTDDYAGLPTYRCSDPHIEPRELANSTYPLGGSCIRPCWMSNGINNDSWYCQLHNVTRSDAKLFGFEQKSSADRLHRGVDLRIFSPRAGLPTGPILLCVFYFFSHWQLRRVS